MKHDRLVRFLDNLDTSDLALLLAAIRRRPDETAETIIRTLFERLPAATPMPPQILEVVAEVVRGLSDHDLAFLAASLDSVHRPQVVDLMRAELRRRRAE